MKPLGDAEGSGQRTKRCTARLWSVFVSHIPGGEAQSPQTDTRTCSSTSPGKVCGGVAKRLSHRHRAGAFHVWKRLQFTFTFSSFLIILLLPHPLIFLCPHSSFYVSQPSARNTHLPSALAQSISVLISRVSSGCPKFFSTSLFPSRL